MPALVCGCAGEAFDDDIVATCQLLLRVEHQDADPLFATAFQC